MKKTLGLFAALAVIFLLNADVHSASEGAETSKRGAIYCALDYWEGYCFKHIAGIACYPVDENCNWIDDQTPPEN